MDLIDIQKDLKKVLSAKRYRHSAGVAASARALADKYVLSSKALLHGPVGSILCETKYGIDDKDIKSAIFYHTTGRTNMTLLEKIIFLADYIEPSRDFPGVDTIRKLAEKDLNQAVLSAYNSTIKHLIDQDAYIYDLTFLGRNDMVLLIDGENDTAR